MSDNTISTQIVSYIALAIAIGGMICGVINHRRIRSNCFGRIATVSLDIDPTTPRTEKTDTIELPRRSERLKELSSSPS
jgi:hypothetical protein